MKAMILAAGRGERMRPLTDSVPKPLLAVGGKPLIFWHLEKLAQLGIVDVVINTAWLANQLVEAIGNGQRWGLRVHWSHEPEGGLETAGGLIKALPVLGEEPFLVLNGDVWTDFDFNLLPERLGSAHAHLVLVNNPPHHPNGDFALSAEQQVVKQGALLTYSGISLMHPALFAGYQVERLPLRPLFEKTIAAGLMTGQYYQGQWTDVGTPARLAQLNTELTGAP